jgi:hypothetical protein
MGSLLDLVSMRDLAMTVDVIRLLNLVWSSMIRLLMMGSSLAMTSSGLRLSQVSVRISVKEGND